MGVRLGAKWRAERKVRTEKEGKRKSMMWCRHVAKADPSNPRLRYAPFHRSPRRGCRVRDLLSTRSWREGRECVAVRLFRVP